MGTVRNAARLAADGSGQVLAAVLPLLACPACRSEAYPLVVRADGLHCPECRARFPVYRNGGAAVPWLFRDPEGFLLEWRARFNAYLHASTAEQARLNDCLADPGCGKAAKHRIGNLIKAKEAQRRQIFELLAPLGLDTPRSSSALDRSGLLQGRLPRRHGLTSYYDNVFRDWAWNNGENDRLLDCLARVIEPLRGFRAGVALTLGAGSGRLSYDFHRRYSPDQSIGLDVNPLLTQLASRMVQGHTVPLYEFPIAPLNHGSLAVLRSCAAPEALSSERAGRFTTMLADGMHPPFKAQSLDTVITPWFIDIIPQDMADCARVINRVLREGGVWLNTGSLAFSHRKEAWCYSEEEVPDLLRANGFELVAAERASIPYLQSPASAHGRVEGVFSFSARKVSAAPPPKASYHLPPWLREAGRPVPDVDEFVVASADYLLRAQALAAIDGRRTIDEIALLVAKRYGLQSSEARAAIARIFLEVYEAASVKVGSTANLE